MKNLLAILLIGLAACSTTRSGGGTGHSGLSASAAQAIVDRMAQQHADIARLSIIAVPPGESTSRIIASTVRGRIGELADPEDLQALRSGQPVVLHEGHNLDYTLPVRDDSGRALGVVGMTVSGATGASQEALLDRARQLAQEVAAQIRAAK